MRVLTVFEEDREADISRALEEDLAAHVTSFANFLHPL